MPECEFVSAADVPRDRCRRFTEINRLEVGQAVFVPDSEFGPYTADPGHVVRSHAYNRSRRFGRKFRTQRGMHEARIGTFVIRLE